MIFRRGLSTSLRARSSPSPLPVSLSLVSLLSLAPAVAVQLPLRLLVALVDAQRCVGRAQRTAGEAKLQCLGCMSKSTGSFFASSSASERFPKASNHPHLEPVDIIGVSPHSSRTWAVSQGLPFHRRFTSLK